MKMASKVFVHQLLVLLISHFIISHNSAPSLKSDALLSHGIQYASSFNRSLLQGILKGFGQATNIILDESHERVYSTKVCAVIHTKMACFQFYTLPRLVLSMALISLFNTFRNMVMTAAVLSPRMQTEFKQGLEFQLKWTGYLLLLLTFILPCLRYHKTSSPVSTPISSQASVPTSD